MVKADNTVFKQGRQEEGRREGPGDDGDSDDSDDSEDSDDIGDSDDNKERLIAGSEASSSLCLPTLQAAIMILSLRSLSFS